ncbi:PhnD/SsuA/transferrin family substrate-binding protein [Halorubrum aethiopicum]|uniref:PhnD/SsuA/transferrin family substrate-binding protein n=1 Tax=Halorubrum aethiopicum TaxID=1758255 RepID=UPI0009B5CA96|nr:PhnD/SsuA/transferrin family substrate-binding protein [Halorubrum aethiopicum]
MRRRKYLRGVTGVGTVGLGGVAGCLGNSGSGNEDVVRFGLTPVEGDVDTREQWRPLFEYVEEEAGVTVEVNEASNYAAILQAFRNDQIDISGTPHTVAIMGNRMEVTDVVGLRRAFGTDREFAFITTFPDDDISDISELAGTEITFADPLSTPGALFPLSMLSEGGLDIGEAPTGDANDFEATYSDHAVAREQLINRESVKAAGTGSFSVVEHVPPEQLPERFVENDPAAESAGSAEPALDLLAVSEPIPRPPILSRREWESENRDPVEQALLDAPSEAFISEDAEFPLWFDGVVTGGIEEYDPVAEVMMELGIDLETYEEMS